MAKEQEERKACNRILTLKSNFDMNIDNAEFKKIKKIVCKVTNVGTMQLESIVC